ncbi:unnamed protein product [Lampetra planeri]
MSELFLESLAGAATTPPDAIVVAVTSSQTGTEAIVLATGLVKTLGSRPGERAERGARGSAAAAASAAAASPPLAAAEKMPDDDDNDDDVKNDDDDERSSQRHKSSPCCVLVTGL